MKFLSLLSFAFIAAAYVSANSAIATGADEGKVPQMLNLISKFEHANPSDPSFATDYAAELPRLASLHKDVEDQFGEKQVRKLYGGDKSADKLVELVKSVKPQKRDAQAKPPKASDKKKNDNKDQEVNKHKQNEKQSSDHKNSSADKHNISHSQAVNKHNHSKKQSSAHKKNSVDKHGHRGHEANKGTHGEKQPTAHKSTPAEESEKPATEDKVVERAQLAKPQTKPAHHKEVTHKKQPAHSHKDAVHKHDKEGEKKHQSHKQHPAEHHKKTAPSDGKLTERANEPKKHSDTQENSKTKKGPAAHKDSDGKRTKSDHSHLVNKHKQGEKPSTAHKQTANQSAHPQAKQNKKPAHKHKSKIAPIVSA